MNAQAKTTPGPWHIGFIKEDGQQVILGKDKNGNTVIVGMLDAKTSAEDAHLITLVPAYLEALEKIQGNINKGLLDAHINKKLAEEIFDIITKATTGGKE